MDHEELLRRFDTPYSEMSEEGKRRRDRADAQWRDQVARGEFAQRKEGDNFPIGMDPSGDLFPVTERATESSQHEDESERDVQPVVGPVSGSADAVLAYGVGHHTVGRRDPESGEWITTDGGQGRT